mgnify:CR=1 FL=1
MQTIEIRHIDGTVLYTHTGENTSLRDAVEAAVRDGADLSGANLSGANLSGADLSGTTYGNEALTKAPLSICNLRWPVLITGQQMQIGCQLHKHEDWEAFDNAAIAAMDGRDALRFWQANREWLLVACKAHKNA